MRYSPPRRRTHTSQRATGRIGAFSTISTLAAALALASPSAGVAAQPPTSAGWHGRAIHQPQPPTDAIATTPGSVREVQRRLVRLGYRPGPVDGLFGAQTQAAVQWFQIKHGLAPDGVAGPRTLGLLRERTGGAPALNPIRDDRPSGRGIAPQLPPLAATADRNEKPAGQRGDGSGPAGLVALVLLLLAVPVALALSIRRRLRQQASKQRRPGPADLAVAAGPAPQPPRSTDARSTDARRTNGAATPALAIGYVRSTQDRAELARHAGAIRRACTRRGWTLEELVLDERARGASLERPGLAAAMERLALPGPTRLVVSKLGHLSSSAADLTALFEWFAEHDVQVVATDVGVDTTTPEGRRAAQERLTAVARRQAQARKNHRKRERRHSEVAVAAVARAGSNGHEAHG
jgi:peptidoglycan hydrolase-like protein with peptidoglycan-binding domain